MELNSSENAQTIEGAAKVRHFYRKEVQKKIDQHPCYSKGAHKYARMHLPVAPACNIQCNYCNRKYDCSNESRPGVVSNLIDPPAALKQFTAIKKRVPNLTVAGIAGPGDALANPKATFASLKLIKQQEPDAQLCISTNGLALLDHIDELVEVGVEHLTITINTIDPEVGAKIYPWIFYNHKRLRGVEASTVLIQRQLEGLSAASLAGMLIKVNTVLIPGVNDEHIEALAKEVKKRGAMLHNIMPLISDPAHGTYFGLTGQPGPTEEELNLARERAGVDMAQMTHCQQCRADAVGTLGSEGGCSTDSNCSPTDSTDKASSTSYKIAVAGSDELIKLHFGHATQFEVYEITEQNIQHIETRIVSQYCTGNTECADNEDIKERLIDTIADCDEVLCTKIGITPWRELEKRGVTPNVDHAFQPKSLALKAIAKRVQAEFNTEPSYSTELRKGA